MSNFAKGRRSTGGRRDAPIELMVKTTSRKGGAGYQVDVTIESEALGIAIGPGSLCDAVSRALTLHHAESIAEGRRPSGGMQAPLSDRGATAARVRAGQRPNVRGNTGKPSQIPANMTRGEIRVSGAGARCDIFPHRPLQGAFIDREAESGNEFLAVEGAADRVIGDAVTAYMDTVFDGPQHWSPESTKAKDLR